MEAVSLFLEDRDFDRLLHTSVPERGDLKVAVKQRATVGGQPGIVIAFTAVVDGKDVPVHAVTTFRQFMAVAAGLRGYAARIGFTDF